MSLLEQLHYERVARHRRWARKAVFDPGINIRNGRPVKVLPPKPEPTPEPEPASEPQPQQQETAVDLALVAYDITPEDIEEFPKPPPTIRAIQLATIKRHEGASLVALLSQSRTAKIMRPRQIAMHLAKRLTSHSYPEIGRRFGGRDHTTILHGARKIAKLINTDIAVAITVNDILADLRAQGYRAPPIPPAMELPEQWVNYDTGAELD
jgi:hypothetical protein